MNSDYCISISSAQSATCLNFDATDGGYWWEGSTATLLHNGAQIGTLPYGFTNREFCLPVDEVDAANDEFKLIAGQGDDVSLFFAIN